MLTIHHLGKSQSERIVWLCEELGVPYTLKHYVRDKVTMLSPPELRALHPLGAAPVLTEGDVVLAESAAIMEYIIAKHGGGRLALGPEHPDYRPVPLLVPLRQRQFAAKHGAQHDPAPARSGTGQSRSCSRRRAV